MKNYVYIYRNNNTNQAPTSEAMEAWNNWFSSLGDHVLDGGSPIASKTMLLENGMSTTKDDSIIGYAVIEAKDMDEAVNLAKGCPLAHAPGCAVQIYETKAM